MYNCLLLIKKFQNVFKQICINELFYTEEIVSGRREGGLIINKSFICLRIDGIGSPSIVEKILVRQFDPLQKPTNLLIILARNKNILALLKERIKKFFLCSIR